MMMRIKRVLLLYPIPLVLILILNTMHLVVESSSFISMYGGISQIGEYYVLLQVGNTSNHVLNTLDHNLKENATKKMIFRVQVDTGSSSLLLSDVDCTSCKNKNDSNTAETAFIYNDAKIFVAEEVKKSDDSKRKKHFKNPLKKKKNSSSSSSLLNHDSEQGLVFTSQFYDPKRDSSSAAPILCDSPLCDAGKCNHLECQSQVCGIESKACCSSEEPTMCGFYLQYGGDTSHRVTARGVMYLDQISLRVKGNDGSSSDYMISGRDAVIYSALLETGEWPTEVDGILGMGYPFLNCNPTCSKPAFETLPEAADQFSVCMGDHFGALVLGDYNDNQDHKIVSDLTRVQWTPILGGGSLNSYYLLETRAFMVDSIDLVSVALRAVENSKQITDLTMKRLQSAIRTSIVDTGTTLLLLEDQIFMALLIHMRQNYCHIEGVCGPIDQSIFTFGQCYTSLPRYEQFPTFKLHLGPNTVLLIPPELYFIRFVDTDPAICQQFGKGQQEKSNQNTQPSSSQEQDLESCAIYCFGIQNSGSGASILGDTLLRGYSTIFDRKLNRIGFGLANRTLCGDVHGLLDAQLYPSLSGVRSGHQAFLIIHLVGGVLALIAGLIILFRVSGICERHRGYMPIGNV